MVEAQYKKVQVQGESKMRNIKIYLLVAIASTLLTACDGGAKTSETATSDTALPAAISSNLKVTAIEAMLQDTREKLNVSRERGFAWTGLTDLLTQAEQALAQGELERANDLAALLSKQTSAAVQQADYSDAHWLESIPD